MSASRAASIAEFPIGISRPKSVRSPSEISDPFGTEVKAPVIRRRFKNQRLVGEYEKPWLEVRDPRAKLPNIIFWTGMLAAVIIGGFIIYRGYEDVPRPEFCLEFEDNFQTLDLTNWNREVQIDGFGTGAFDWTTNDERNSYVDEKGLHIVPTLTTDDTDITPEQLYNGYTLNLTKDHTCTAPMTSRYLNTSCWITSNYTSGATIPPVRSARLTTEGKHSIRYGRVEVVAKMGRGDWLWPAIWMMPEMGGAYGPWPASGEIDLAEFRGNDPKTYGDGAIDAIQSTIHWGPNPLLNRYWQTSAKRILVRDDFTTKFRTFGLEWTPDYLFIYVDTRLNKIFDWKFPSGSSMWNRGGFQYVEDGAGNHLTDPWSQTGRASTPFDQKFFLILNVAVGSRNKYFPDAQGGKPWTDSSMTNVREFALANKTWHPTWDKEGMVVKSVKMWNLGKCQ